MPKFISGRPLLAQQWQRRLVDELLRPSWRTSLVASVTISQSGTAGRWQGISPTTLRVLAAR